MVGLDLGDRKERTRAAGLEITTTCELAVYLTVNDDTDRLHVVGLDLRDRIQRPNIALEIHLSLQSKSR